MSDKEEFLDGEELALNELESGSLVDVDDYVTDYRPHPDNGCRASLALQLDMSSNRGEDLHPDAPIMGDRGGYGGILSDGRCFSVPNETCVHCDFKMNSDDINEMRRLLPKQQVDSSPGHKGGYARTTIILSTGSERNIEPCHSGTFIFVQGKKSACIASLDSVKDEETSFNLEMTFGGFADSELILPAVLRCKCKENVDIHPYAAVSVPLVPDSSLKDPASRSPEAAEESAIDFLKHELENGCFDSTIKTAIIALQYLYGENVKAQEIAVYAFQDNKMDFLTEEEIERYLTLINNV